MDSTNTGDLPTSRANDTSVFPVIAANATWLVTETQKLPELNFKSFATIVAPIARDIEVAVHIPMLVPIIQAAHESRNGNSGLARNHGNLFGIVATDAWKKSGNAIATMPTFEFIKDNRVETTREFRGYKSWRDSFFDWSRLISGLSVYKKAYQLLQNPATVPEGITEMAKIYATDPQYSRSLLDLYAAAGQGGVI